MSRKNRKINEKFLSAYIELDKLCCAKFGVEINGVTEYINRLQNARFAPNRDELLKTLGKYRNLRNRFAHEPQAINKCEDITKADVKWVNNFKKTVKGKNDSISKYLKKARRFARRRKFGRFVLVLLIIAALAIAGYFLFV